MDGQQRQSFEELNDRLKQIASLVEDESLDLDEALGLLEEAVGLGVKASSLLEEDIAAANREADEQAAALGDSAAGAAGEENA